ncbi:MAG: hypothetical protein JKY95_16325 [Planctomycetaceae bacterium]|nr:hypothetical protein [Planctomycetaceae bacterium]
MIIHYKTIRRFQNDAELTEKQRSALVDQHKRRRITTGLLIAVGVLIPASDIAMTLLKSSILATLILFALLVLILIIFLYALGDMVTGRMTREDLALKKAEAELKRRVLEQELAQYQNSGSILKNLDSKQNSENRRNGYQK